MKSLDFQLVNTDHPGRRPCCFIHKDQEVSFSTVGGFFTPQAYTNVLLAAQC